MITTLKNNEPLEVISNERIVINNYSGQPEQHN